MSYELTPLSELQWRLSRFQKMLRDNDVSGSIITQNTDLFYFAGTIQRSYLFIPAQGEPVLAVNGNLERAIEESRLKNVVRLKGLHQLHQVLGHYGYKIKDKIGLEMDILPASFYLSFQKDYKEADFVDVSELIRQTRMIKSKYELERIKKACYILDQLMEKAKGIVKVGMTELEVDAVLTAFTRERGHMGFFRARAYNQDMNYSHILFGSSSALSSYVKGPLGGKGTTPAIPLGAGFSVITENLPLIVDFGMGFSGYVSDMTRTFVVGKLPAELEKAHEVTREIKHFMQGWVKPGKSPAHLYHDIIELVSRRGLKDHFMGYKQNSMPFVGHGIGLEIDEYPIIAPGFDLEFSQNMVFAFEPKMAFPGIGSVGIEDDFVVTDNGVEVLTKYDDSILVVKNS